jgi:prepilin-type N-terminal cleavage/methylation domain-containing protein
MNKNGLTLIELIAVIVIIGVIAGIATFFIGNIIEDQRKSAILADAQVIESAARLYCINETCTIGDILTENELSNYVSNIKEDYNYQATVLDGYTYTVIIYSENNFSFPYNEDGILVDGLIASLANESYVNKPSGGGSSEITIPEGQPYVLLNGSETVYVEIAKTYDDPGAVAYTSEGTVIDSTWTEGSVNFWQLGTYERTYHAYSSFDQENCKPATRYITVVDTTPPVITINGDETFYVEVNSYYSDWGAWAQDNSGQSVTVTTEGVDGVDFNTIGTYYVTYTAVDGSGNEATAIRTVIVR